MASCPHCGAMVESLWSFCPACRAPLETAAPPMPAPARRLPAEFFAQAVHLQMAISDVRAGHACVLDWSLTSAFHSPVTATLTVLCASLERGQVRSAPVLLVPGGAVAVAVSAVATQPGEALATAVVEIIAPETTPVLLLGQARLWVQADAALHIGNTINVGDGGRALGIDASIDARGDLAAQLDVARGAPSWFQRGCAVTVPLSAAPPDFAIPAPLVLGEPPNAPLPRDLAEVNDAAYREFVHSWGDDATRLDDLCWELGDPSRGLAAWANEKWLRMCEAARWNDDAGLFVADAMAAAEGPHGVGAVFGWEMMAASAGVALAGQLSGEAAWMQLDGGNFDAGILALESHPRVRTDPWLRLALAYAWFYYKGDSAAALTALGPDQETTPDLGRLFRAFVHAMRDEPADALATLALIRAPEMEVVVGLMSARQTAMLGRRAEAIEQFSRLAQESAVVAVRLVSEPGLERRLLEQALGAAVRPALEAYRADLRGLLGRLAAARDRQAGRWEGRISAGWVRLLDTQVTGVEALLRASAGLPAQEMRRRHASLPAVEQSFIEDQRLFIRRTERSLQQAVDDASEPALEDGGTTQTGGLGRVFGGRKQAAAAADQRAAHAARQDLARAALQAFRAHQPNLSAAPSPAGGDRS